MLDNENSALRDLLISNGCCSAAALDEVEEEHDRSGVAFMDVIVNYGLVKKSKILQLIAENIGTQVVDIEAYPLTAELLKTVDPGVARSYGVFPVCEEDGTLFLALRSPLDFLQQDELRFILNRDFQAVVADPDQIDQLVAKYYPEDASSVAEIIEMLNAEAGNYNFDDIKDLAQASNDPPVMRYVDMCIAQGIRDKASDIHFEPFEKDFRVRYRVDGALYEMQAPPRELARPIISRVKILSGLNISETRIPQDGRIQTKLGGKPVDLRVSCLPTTHGESVVLRVLDRSVVNLDLDVLGLDPQVNKLPELS